MTAIANSLDCIVALGIAGAAFWLASLVPNAPQPAARWAGDVGVGAMFAASVWSVLLFVTVVL